MMSLASRVLCTLFVPTILLLHSCGAAQGADLSTKEKELVQLVRSRIQANYAPVTSIQANVTSLLVEPKPKEAPAPKEEQAPKAAARFADEGGLTSSVSADGARRWTATIAGLDERFEENSKFGGEPFHKIEIRRGDVELEYSPPHYARLYPPKPEFVRGNSYYDPREVMLLSREDSLATLLTDDRVRSAVLLTDGGKKRIRIETNAFHDYRVILECSEFANFLPTQVYFINDGEYPEYKGTVQFGATVEYSSAKIGEQIVLFPQRVVRKFGGQNMTRDTAAYMQLDAQTDTTSISDLKLNERLADNAFTAPAISKEMSFYCTPEVDLAKVPAELRELATENRREQEQVAAARKKELQPIEDLVGKSAPALPGDGWVNGKRPDLAGKPYLVHFWAVWCGPCKNDYANVRTMLADGVRFVGMHPPGMPVDEVEAFAKDRELAYPTFVQPENEFEKLDKTRQRMIAGYPSCWFPYYILVDAEGKVAAHGQLQAMALKLEELRPKSPNRE